MIIGVMSDTHGDEDGAIPHIIKEFKKREVEVIIHCGDIIAEHLKPELFGGLPVVCALIEEQLKKPEFENPPGKWVFTKPGQRIHDLSDRCRVYVGHKMSFSFLAGSEAALVQKMQEIRTTYDGVRWLFSGHTHHQIYKQGHLISFVNPGAIADSFDGYEFAVIDTIKGQIVFGRVPKTKPVAEDFSVGVISDSLNISGMDPGFWKKLADEFKERGVKHIIHCGNIALPDIGHKDLDFFEVHYNLRPDQISQAVEHSHKNWHQILPASPVVEINGYKFYVQLDLGVDLLDQSEVQMHRVCLNLRKKYPEISFVLCGLTNSAFLEEGQEMRIINPGDVLNDRNFVVVCLPRAEITFGHVPADPLPKL